MTLAITNHYVDLNEKDGAKFINPFTRNLATWCNKKVRNIIFFYAPQHKFNTKKAGRLIRQVVKLESEWNLKPINIRYYLAKTSDELQILKGFDFALPMRNRDKPSGISDDTVEEHPQADLNNIEDFWCPDPHTDPGSAKSDTSFTEM